MTKDNTTFDKWVGEVRGITMDEYFELPEEDQIKLEEDFAVLGLYSLEDEKYGI